MSCKRTLLQLPLNIQIYIFISAISIIVFYSTIFISESLTASHVHYLMSTHKNYYYNIKQYIIESEIFFMNLCILQYELLVKLFNYQYYSYLIDNKTMYYFEEFYTFSPDIIIKFYMLIIKENLAKKLKILY